MFIFKVHYNIMFIIKVVAVILVYVSIVNGSELSDVNKQDKNVDGATSRVYKYNHPPFASIPVAIVLDDEQDPKVKSINTEVSKSSNVTTEGVKTTTPTVIRLTSVFKTKTSNDNSNQPLAKAYNEDEIHIPVAIVYEEPTVTTPRIQKKTLRRKQGKRRSSKKDIKTTTQIPTTLEDNTTAQNTVEKGTLITTSEKTVTRKAQENSSKSDKRTRERDPVVPIIQSENRVFAHSGNFHYSYEGGDGTKAFATGELKSFEDNKTGEAVQGEFSYTAKDGKDYSLSYTADENGYRPVGAHLPTPPPIPPAIARALAYLATKTTPETITESSR